MLHDAPTGIDRVELAYARELMRLVPDRLAFAAMDPLLRYGRVPVRAAAGFLDLVESWWEHGRPGVAGRWRRRAAAAPVLWGMRPGAVPPGHRRSRVLIQSSPHHLHHERLVRRILVREQAAFVCLLHDLIPLEYPEYSRPGGGELHRRRIGTIARLASAVVANSHATLDAFRPHLAAAGREVPLVVAHLGLDHVGAPPPGARAGARPYFVCVGTIEPRKNHLLLLHVWRRLAETLGPSRTPELVIIGRRGWENEQVVDLLERSPPLQGVVRELGGAPDAELRRQLAGARALLLPSFAEGFGMPIPEALAAGVPVLCSDMPALREAGDDVPDFLDPLDGPAWIDAVLAYAEPGSPRRAAQCERIGRWRPPSWRSHMETVLAIADQAASRAGPVP